MDNDITLKFVDGLTNKIVSLIEILESVRKTNKCICWKPTAPGHQLDCPARLVPPPHM